jgi:16S rRNA (uracil1498-N3)-methyltransferase
VRQVFVNEALTGLQETQIVGDDYRHLTLSLRMKTGEGLRLVDPGRQVYRGTIRAIDRKAVHVSLEGSESNLPAEREATLGLCMTAHDAFDASLDAAVQMGVTSFVPLLSARSKAALKPRRERWERIAREAACQSFRLRCPEIKEAMSFEAFLAQEKGKRFIAKPGASVLSARSLSPEAPFSVLVGPEGGFENSELEAAAASGWSALGLGPAILRVPVAVVAALSTLQTGYWEALP